MTVPNLSRRGQSKHYRMFRIRKFLLLPLLVISHVYPSHQVTSLLMKFLFVTSTPVTNFSPPGNRSDIALSRQYPDTMSKRYSPLKLEISTSHTDIPKANAQFPSEEKSIGALKDSSTSQLVNGRVNGSMLSSPFPWEEKSIRAVRDTTTSQLANGRVNGSMLSSLSPSEEKSIRTFKDTSTSQLVNGSEKVSMLSSIFDSNLNTAKVNENASLTDLEKADQTQSFEVKAEVNRNRYKAGEQTDFDQRNMSAASNLNRYGNSYKAYPHPRIRQGRDEKNLNISTREGTKSKPRKDDKVLNRQRRHSGQWLSSKVFEDTGNITNTDSLSTLNTVQQSNTFNFTVESPPLETSKGHFSDALALDTLQNSTSCKSNKKMLSMKATNSISSNSSVRSLDLMPLEITEHSENNTKTNISNITWASEPLPTRTSNRSNSSKLVTNLLSLWRGHTTFVQTRIRDNQNKGVSNPEKVQTIEEPDIQEVTTMKASTTQDSPIIRNLTTQLYVSLGKQGDTSGSMYLTTGVANNSFDDTFNECLNRSRNMSNKARLLTNIETSGSTLHPHLGQSVEPTQNVMSYTSCDRRCGEDASFPCSCNEKCVVHKTCCHDMNKTCPELYREALTKFSSLLSASISCDVQTTVLMVQSCPSQLAARKFEAASDGGEFVQSLPAARSSPKEHQNKNAREIGLITRIVSNAPVTDYDTGIIYANWSIYECNKQVSFFGCSLASNGSAHSWKTQIGGVRRQGAPSEVNQSDLDLTASSYIPPLSHPIHATSLCYSEETLSCIANFSTTTGIQNIRCNMSISEYYTMRKKLLRVSRPTDRLVSNICELCLSEYQYAPGSLGRFDLSGFRVLMSLSETPGQVVYDVHEELRGQRTPLPNWSWTCSITDDITRSLEDSSCRVLECNPRFFLTEDGFCRKAIEADFSVQQYVLVNGRNCRIDIIAFASAVKCYVQTFYNLVPTKKPHRVYSMYYALRNTNLTGIRMEMYFNSTDYEKDVMGLTEFDLFYATMLLFVQNYCSSMTDVQGKFNNGTVHGLPSVSNTDAKHGRRALAKEEDLISLAKISTYTQMFEYFFFQMCLQSARIDGNLEDKMICNLWSGVIKSSNKLGSSLDKAKKTKCILRKDAQSKSQVKNAFFSLFVFCFSVVMSSLNLLL